jgi:hypothetical protein
MSKKSCLVSVLLLCLSGFAWLSASEAQDGTAASPEVASNIGHAILKAYTFVPVHPKSAQPCVVG